MEQNIENLAKILSKHSLTKLEYSDSETHILLERTPAPQIQAAGAVQPAALPAISAPSGETAPTETRTPVKAAFVGTVYRRRKPEEPPICDIGTKVKEGDPLCVIEAMKMFTDIVSPVSGTVSEICFEDGNLAEYGQVLIYIE
jgi:acetyl-CoA carboxylase biotin carboxyl carrier protein